MLLDFCDVSRAAIALLPHPHDDRPFSTKPLPAIAPHRHSSVILGEGEVRSPLSPR
jgi:hypothetical protein